MSSLYVDHYCQSVSSLLLDTGYRVTVAMVLCLDGISGTTSALPQWPKLYASINLAQCYTFILPLH